MLIIFTSLVFLSFRRPSVSQCHLNGRCRHRDSSQILDFRLYSGVQSPRNKALAASFDGKEARFSIGWRIEQVW